MQGPPTALTSWRSCRCNCQTPPDEAERRAAKRTARWLIAKIFFARWAAQYRQLAEIAGNPEIKQRMLDMAAHYQDKADEHGDER
jgi:hypothetical protein